MTGKLSGSIPMGSIPPRAPLLQRVLCPPLSALRTQAIAAAMDMHYPVEEVAGLLAELKASGDYDRILAETAS
jgi:hypothetical protein